MGRYTSGGVGRDILAGAVAGVAAIWVADKLDQAMYRAGGPQSIRRTEAARPGGMDPAHVLAKRAADAVGADLGDPKDNAAGHTVHYGIAAGMGALYGLLRGMSPTVSTARGAMFGVAMFVLQDEIGNTVMRTAGNPLDYPIRDHARGAAAHTLFGVVTDLVTRLISPWRDTVVIEQGPPLSERLERGRAYAGEQLAQGRAYLNQGMVQGVGYAGDYAARGQRYAGQMADTVRSRLPEVDAAELAKTARRQGGRFADTVRSSVQEVPTSGLSRAMERLFG